MPKDSKTNLPGADLLFGSAKKEKVSTVVEEEKTEEREKKAIPFKIAPVEETEPVKFTFYFPPQLLEDLEVAKFRLRMEKRLKVSKSDIVNAALQYVLKDMGFLERLVKGEIK